VLSFVTLRLDQLQRLLRLRATTTTARLAAARRVSFLDRCCRSGRRLVRGLDQLQRRGDLRLGLPIGPAAAALTAWIAAGGAGGTAGE
jgi:hypothetical protein